MTTEEERQKWVNDQNLNKIVRRFNELRAEQAKLCDERVECMDTLESEIKKWPEGVQNTFKDSKWYRDELQYSESYRLTKIKRS